MDSNKLDGIADYRAAIGAAAGTFLLVVAGILSVYLFWTIKEAVEVLGR
jgi:hypothetical protein